VAIGDLSASFVTGILAKKRVQAFLDQPGTTKKIPSPRSGLESLTTSGRATVSATAAASIHRRARLPWRGSSGGLACRCRLLMMLRHVLTRPPALENRLRAFPGCSTQVPSRHRPLASVARIGQRHFGLL